jgi:hypothetical protein
MSFALLPQPGGFEGVGFGLEPAMPNDPSISQRPDVSGVRRDRLVVCPAHQNEANGDDDFFPCRNEFKRLDTPGRPDLAQPSHELPDALVAVIDAWVKGPPRRVPFDLRIKEVIGLVIEVLEDLVLPLCVEPPHNLHVLLRHRPRSISRLPRGRPTSDRVDASAAALALVCPWSVKRGARAVHYPADHAI